MAGSQRRGARGATAVYRGAHGATSAVYVRMDVVERMGMINKHDGDSVKSARNLGWDRLVHRFSMLRRLGVAHRGRPGGRASLLIDGLGQVCPVLKRFFVRKGTGVELDWRLTLPCSLEHRAYGAGRNRLARKDNREEGSHC